MVKLNMPWNGTDYELTRLLAFYVTFSEASGGIFVDAGIHIVSSACRGCSDCRHGADHEID